MRKILGVICAFAMVCMFAGSAYSDLSDGLVAYYPFDGDASDYSGNGNDGTEYGGLGYVDAVHGQGVSFDGADDYVRIPQSAELNFGMPDNYTICFFARIDPVNYETVQSASIIEKWEGDPYSPYPFVIRVANPEYGIPPLSSDLGDLHALTFDHYVEPISPDYNAISDGVHSREKVTADNQWHHIALQKEGSESLRLFIDGSLIDEDDDFEAIQIYNETDIYVGRRGGNNSHYYLGLMDDLRFYNRALSSTEICQLHHDPVSETYDAGNCADGVDNDCDGSVDTDPECTNGGTCAGSVAASTVETRSVYRSSDLAKHLTWFSVPLGVAIGLMVWRRKR